MNKVIKIGPHVIGGNNPVFVIAEMSANHLKDFDRAKEIIRLAKESGADAIKLQTYRPDTITFNSRNEEFMAEKGGLWEGKTLYELYESAYTPWEWHSALFSYAEEIGLTIFSSPFDLTAVDFLEELDVPAYKIASYEINDIPLIKKTASTGKPMIISTGIAEKEDIELALDTCRSVNNENVILLKCASEYPTPYDDLNLRSIGDIESSFDCIVGLSNHSMGSAVDVAAVALGACVIEKHLTVRRSDGGPDGAFSMEPEEFSEMVVNIRNAQRALGNGAYTLTRKQKNGRSWSRSLYVVKDMKKGDEFTEDNLKSIRPGYGLHTKYYFDLLGRKCTSDIKAGSAMKLEFAEGMQ